jgi:hypothetical protein
MSTGPETRIVKLILDAAKALPRPIWIEKIHGGPYQAAGIPDLIGCYEGELFGVEVKDPDALVTPSERAAVEKLTSLGIPTGRAKGCTALQALHIRRIIDAGGRAGVATGVEEALAIITERHVRT